jgi:phage terminase Nu1 subunit (DNA packaging protein)
VKTKKTELEVAKMEGRLVDVQDVRRLWGDIANTVMQNMIHLPSKVAPMVVMMKSAEQIAAIIDREVRDILNSIADAPVPEYAQASISDEEGEDDGEV